MLPSHCKNKVTDFLANYEFHQMSYQLAKNYSEVLPNEYGFA